MSDIENSKVFISYAWKNEECAGLEWLLNSGFLYHIHTNKLHTNHIANLVMTTSKVAQA